MKDFHPQVRSRARTRGTVISGVGMTSFGKHPGRNIKSLVAEAVADAIADAGVSTHHIGMAYYSNVASGLLQATFIDRTRRMTG